MPEKTRTPLPRASRLAIIALLAGACAAAEAASFREVSERWGLTFRHHHAGSGSFYMVETMGSGVVLFDYDGDGDIDVLFVDSGELPGYDGEPPRSKLFRNDGGAVFVDASRALPDGGLSFSSDLYAMGATAGDVDRDGDLDLYVTGYGVNVLLVNRGDGSFMEVSEAGDASWSTSAAFADVDLDGDLDLYVANYVDFTIDTNKPCGDLSRGLRSYCHPDAYDGVPDSFWLNDGRGGFDRSKGIEPADPGKGLGVVFLDDDVDGRPDLYVANDMTANMLFRNQGGARFSEEGLISGVAYSDRGDPEAGMGVAAGDLDGDGQVEIFVTHLDQQSNALYGRQEGGFYLDERRAAGVVEASYQKVGFGTAFADLDNDGDLDVVVANGHIIHNIEEFGTGTTYRQANQVFLNDGAGRVVEAANVGLNVVRSSRGLAVGDLDGDGDLDLVISNSNEACEVYENSGAAGSWAELALRGAASDRFGVGARIRVSTPEEEQSAEVRTGSSYLSQSALPRHFGLGGADRLDRVEIDWPSGVRQAVLDLPAGGRLIFYEPENDR